MTRLPHLLTYALAAATLLAAGCSPDSAPASDGDAGTKKVLSSCHALGGDDASKILGTTVVANRMAGDDAPISICACKDTANVTVALVKIDKDGKYPDQTAALAADQKSEQSLFSSNIKQPKYRAADGFAPGSFYGDITPRFDALEVELGTFQNGVKMLFVVNNPKDFATGEKQAAAMANKVLENMKNGTAYATM